jgi:hypothetical protein
LEEKSINQKPFFLRLRRLTTLLEQRANANSVSTRTDFLDAALTVCVEMLEGAANTLLWSIPELNEMTAGELERLKLIQKLDLLYFVRLRQSLNYGHHTISKINSLVKNRNFLMHPKPIKSPFASINHSENKIEFESKQNLFSAKDEDIQLIKNCFVFLDLYLIDWCKVKNNEIFQLLLANEIHYSNGNVGFLMPVEMPDVKKRLEYLLGIEIRFLTAVI